MTMRVAAVLPTIDEVGAIEDVVRGLLRQPSLCCVIVVDGGSIDGTPDAARRAGAIVLDEPRRGYGRACRTGTAAALAPAPTGHGHEAVAFLDGDGSCDPDDIGALIRALDGVDLVLGRRRRADLEPGAMPWHAFLGNLLVAGLASVLSRRRIHDLPPSKVIRADALRRLHLDDDRFGWTTQLATRALADRTARVVEVPVSFRRRRGGISKVSGSWRASILAGRSMVATVAREHRARPVLVLMAKAPRAGHAKTRLAADLGDDLTAGLWTACLGDAADGVAAAGRDARGSWLAMVPLNDDVEPVRGILGPMWEVRAQTSPGLAGALGDVFMEAADRGADRAIAIAGDSPGLGTAPILAALRALDRGPTAAVLGPTADGGYHLIGLRLPRVVRGPEVEGVARSDLRFRLTDAFGASAMGTQTALDVTERALTRAGWTVRRSQPFPDVDTLDDLRALADRLDLGAHGAEQTADWVRRHRDVIGTGSSSGNMAAAPGQERQQEGVAT